MRGRTMSRGLKMGTGGPLVVTGGVSVSKDGLPAEHGEPFSLKLTLDDASRARARQVIELTKRAIAEGPTRSGILITYASGPVAIAASLAAVIAGRAAPHTRTWAGTKRLGERREHRRCFAIAVPGTHPAERRTLMGSLLKRSQRRIRPRSSHDHLGTGGFAQGRCHRREAAAPR